MSSSLGTGSLSTYLRIAAVALLYCTDVAFLHQHDKLFSIFHIL